MSRTGSVGKNIVCMDLRTMQETVRQDAQERYLRELEKEAKDAVRGMQFWTQSVSDGHAQERNEASRRRNQEMHNQNQLKDQIEANKARNAEKRKEYIEAASSHSFPLFTETFISETEVEKYRQWTKDQLRADLDRQRVTQGLLRNKVIKRDKDWAQDKLLDSMKQMKKDRELDFAKKMAEKEELTKAWDHDIRIARIKHGISKGKDVTQHIRQDEPAQIASFD